MRVLLLTQLFDPENAIKGLSFAKALAAAGHQVDVITAYPSYPAGRLFPGFRQKLREVASPAPDVKVTRVLTYISQHRSGVRRMLAYTSFAAMAFVNGVFGTRPDVIYAYYPPIVGGLSAVALGWFRRAPVVYDVQDLWPDAVVASGIARDGWVIRLIGGVADFIYKRAAVVVTLSEGYRDVLVSRGVPHAKVKRIYNWCDESRISVENSVDADETFRLVYAGNLGAAQGLETVIEAAALVQARGERGIEFEFVGDGVEKQRLVELSAQRSLHNVRFVDNVPPEQVGVHLGRAGALLAHLRDDPVFALTVPQKTQAYLMAGRPLLMAIAGESRTIVETAGAGVVVHPGDAAAIAEAAIYLSRLSPSARAEMGRRGRQFYYQHMSQRNGVRQTLDALSLAVAGAR